MVEVPLSWLIVNGEPYGDKVSVLQGQTYAIPTMHGGVDKIYPYVKDFICFAKQHPEMTFLVTEIGCGIAGFLPEEIAPLFNEAILVGNIYLPERFWKVLMS